MPNKLLYYFTPNKKDASPITELAIQSKSQQIYLLLTQQQLFTIHAAAEAAAAAASSWHRVRAIARALDSCVILGPTFTMPVFSELLFIMSLKDVKRFLKDSMKSASPLFS